MIYTRLVCTRGTRLSTRVPFKRRTLSKSIGSEPAYSKA